MRTALPHHVNACHVPLFGFDGVMRILINYLSSDAESGE